MNEEIALSDLISETLNELQTTKTNPHKSRYKVDELLIEMHVTQLKRIDGKISFKILEAGAENATNHAHKITVKLTPKNHYAVRPQNKRA